MTARPTPARARRSRLVPALPGPAWVVLGGDLVSAVGSGLTLPCLFIYAHQVRGLSYSAAGLVVATIALAALAGNPLGGTLADRYTPRRALMAGLAVAAAGSVALAGAHRPAALFAAAGLLGLGVAVVWPAQDALLAGLVPAADRSAVFSVRHATLNAGIGIGALGAAAVVSVAHPATFVAVYLADAATFLAYLPILARLQPAALPANAPANPPVAVAHHRAGYRQVLKDKTFLRVWALTALLVTVSFGQAQVSFAGYATRPGGVTTHTLALAFAANTITVAGAQLFVLRRLAGRRRTTGIALAGAAWAVTWVVVILAGHLGAGPPAQLAFVAAMILFALGETLLSPTLPAIVNDLAPAHAAGRYNALGALAFTTGFLVGPASGAAALGAGWGTGLFAAMTLACLTATLAALRLARQLPPAANHIPAPTPPAPADTPRPSPPPPPAGPHTPIIDKPQPSRHPTPVPV